MRSAGLPAGAALRPIGIGDETALLEAAVHHRERFRRSSPAVLFQGILHDRPPSPGPA